MSRALVLPGLLALAFAPAACAAPSAWQPSTGIRAVVVLTGRMVDAVTPGGATTTFETAQLAQQVRLIDQPHAP